MPSEYVFVQRIIDFYKDYLGAFKAGSILITFILLGATIFFMIRTGWIAVRVDRVQDVILKTNLPKKRSIRAWRRSLAMTMSVPRSPYTSRCF